MIGLKMKTEIILNINKDYKKKVVVSWTGGKDGCLACYKAILEGFDISYILNFRDTKKNGSHNINPELLSAQLQAIGVPNLQIDFLSYEQEFKKTVHNISETGVKIEGAVFGHIKTHKDLVDRICSDLDIQLILPLWNCDSEKIITDFIHAGFNAIIVSAKADLFGKEWVGRKIDEKFVSDLHDFNDSIDSCGEYGEFHTFVIDGPLFKNKLKIVNSKKILKDGYWLLDISKYAIEEKRL
jgi:uncharacterized protein (TIGR00290 family)